MTLVVDRAERLHARGVAATAHARPRLGAGHLRAALRLLDEPGIPEGTDELRGRILVSLSYAESEQGRTELALRILTEAEPLLPPVRQGVLFGQRGLLLRRTGWDSRALSNYDAAVELLRERSEPEELARVLLNRGVLHLAAANVRAARTDLRRCAQLTTRHGLTGLGLKARQNLAYLDVLTGDLPAALRAYGALAPEYAVTTPGVLPYLAIDRARALQLAGLFEEADRELATALEQFRRHRISQSYAETLLARAETALLAGHPAVARRWAVQARTVFKRRNNERWAALSSLVALHGDFATARDPTQVAADAGNLAYTLRKLGFADDARDANLLAARALIAAGRVADAEQALAGHRLRRSDRLETRLLWRLSRAEVANAAGQRAVATRELAAGIAELQRYRSQLGGLDLQTGTAVHGRELAATGLRWALEAGSGAAVFRWSERARAQSLLLPPVRPPDDPEAVTALEELRQLRYALREADQTGRPAGDLRARADALQRTVREHSWYNAGPGTATRPASLAAVKAELGDGALVSYLVSGPALLALILVRGRSRLVPLGRYADAAESLRRLRADLDAHANRAMPQRLADTVRIAIARNAATLGTVLLDPIRRLIGERALIVIPTGVLIMVPWGLLPGCTGRPVTVAPSATTWLAARRRLGAHTRRRKVLLVAGPGNERGEPEVRTIAALYPHSTVLSGPQATPAATLAGLAGAETAHLAAHGHHEPENSMFSALELVGGPLTGYDLQRAAGIPALVILSSCELGLSDVRPGDESLGMTTALLAAGAATVVACVSRVADEAAMAVMTRYHQGIHRGDSSAEALAEASTVDTSAAFVCFGAGG